LPLITAQGAPRTLLNDMKRLYKKFGKSKNLTVTDTFGSSLVPATSTSMIIPSTADPMSSAPASSATASLEVIQAADITVSVQPSYYIVVIA